MKISELIKILKSYDELSEVEFEIYTYAEEKYQREEATEFAVKLEEKKLIIRF